MQLKVLLKKDLSALFKQKAVVFTLIFPMIIIIFIGIVPLFVGQSEPFEVGYFIEDEGMAIDNSSLNLGNLILDQLKITFDGEVDLELIELNNYSKFISFENAIWIPKNFTKVANDTREARYYITMSDSNLRASPVMTGVVSQICNDIVTRELLPVIPPTIIQEQVFQESELLNGEAKNRGSIASPLAYVTFLILILGSSSMRLTGFSAEKEADMLELLLSSVIDRREMILSKLITGVLYGFASVTSYIVGIGILFLMNSLNEGPSIIDLIPPGIISIGNIFAVIFLFVIISFISMEILLAAQLSLGREGGEKFGSTGLMILTIMFYATSIVDPLAETPIQLINPFFWAFKVTLNIIFKENLINSILYILALLILSFWLIIIQTRAIEKEKVLFE